MRKKRMKLLMLFVAGFLAAGVLPSKGVLAADNPNQQLIDQGKTIFTENCALCHQADAIGLPGMAPSLSNPELLSLASTPFLEGTITKGRAGTAMPAFQDILKEDQVKAVVGYLRSQGTLPFRGGAVDAEPKSKGNATMGSELFHQVCSTCHGLTGNGYESGGTGTAIGKSGFLDSVSDGFIRETIKYGRSNTRMRGFQGPEGLANLSDREIDDIIAYLRTVPSK